MSPDLWVGIVALAVGVAALVAAIYAITDVRKLVRRYVIEAQRDAVFVEAINRLCWDFVTPQGDNYPPEMAVLFSRFAILQQALDPKRTSQASKEAIEKE